MNPEQIGKQIVEQLLMENFTEKVSLYPGAFKPPHKGHVSIALDSLETDTDKLLLFVSTKAREDVEVEESLKAWELYKESVPGLERMEIVPTATPVKDVYDYAKNNPTHDIKAVFGKGEEARYTSLATKYPNVEIYNAGTVGNYSATDLRKAIRDKDKEAILTFLPDGVNIDDFLSIFQIQENLNEIGDLSQEPYDWKVNFNKSDEEEDIYNFTTDNGDEYEVDFSRREKSNGKINYIINFLAKSKGSQGFSTNTLTGGNEPLKIMSTIVDISKSHIEHKGDVDTLSFYPTKGKTGEPFAKDSTRGKLYKLIIKKNFPKATVTGDDIVNVDVSAYKGEDMFEAIVGNKIVCDNCGWEWKIVDGGDDLYMCHKCGHDNTPRKNYLQEARYKKFLNEGWDSSKAKIINTFLGYCADYLSVTRPTIKLVNSPEYTQTYHSFGGYMPSEEKIIAVVHNRNMADILRTLAHEMVHHMQNLDKRLTPKSGEDGSPDENEANSLAGVIMREFGRNNPHIYE